MKTTLPHSSRFLLAAEPTLLLPSAALPQGMRARCSSIALDDLIRQEAAASFLGFNDQDRNALNSDSTFGRYRIIKSLGRGGFGDVWLAEQQEPLRREVALKVISPGLATREVVSRFERERQAMAMMEHENIAKMYDASSVDDTHYFAMEYVPGLPITKHAKEKNLTLRQRVELFIPVCRAVHHAHQKLVLHRDLKPANILIAERDGVAVPKVIDFGIAKPLSEEHCMVEADTSDMPVTLPGYCVGTPQYMSPEQALGISDIDGTSDTYSLGVILYELLVGEPPITKDDMEGLAPHQQLDRVIHHETQLPSTLWLRSMEASNTRCYDRTLGSNPKHISHELRGALDWIVNKALEKDRSKRYSSANELANDLTAYLSDEPLSVSPPSLIIRLRKSHLFTHLNGLVAALVAFAVLSGGVVALAQWQRATIARDQQIRTQHLAATDETRAAMLDLFHFVVTDLCPKVDEANRSAFMKTLADKAAAVDQAQSHSNSSAAKQSRLSRSSDQPKPFIELAQVLDLAGKMEGKR